MPLRQSALLVIILVAFLAVAAGACRSGSTSAPAEPATAARPSAPAEPAAQATSEPASMAGEPETTSEDPVHGGKYIAPVRGVAEIAYLTPQTVVKNNVVITTITVRNLSSGSIAGLKIEEYWWDKASNPVTGDSVRLSKPLLPGEKATVTLETPKDPKMFRNTYVFRHAFGQIKATLEKSLD